MVEKFDPKPRTFEYELEYPKWTAEERENRVQNTWDWLGERVKAMKLMVWLRTDPVQRIRPSGIIIPESEAAFYAHSRPQKRVWGTVLAATDQTGLKPGDRIVYLREWFLWFKKNQHDGSFFGCIHEQHIDFVDTVDRE